MSKPSNWRRRLKGRLRRAAASLLLRVLGRLSLRGAQRLGRALGRLYWLRNGKTRQVVEDNLARCLPELDAGTRERLARRTLIETGMGVIETAPVWTSDRTRVRSMVRDMPGFEAIETALGARRGAILLAPHIGNWELGGLVTGIRTQTTVMYRPPREPALEALLNESRARFGSHMAPANLRGVRQALRALKRGELVAILPDQAPRHGEGVIAPFFGQSALTMTLIRTLTRRTGAVAFTGWAERLPDAGGFRVHYAPVTEPIDHDDPEQAAAALNREVERIVRQCPAQYQWTYQRFRRQASGRARREERSSRPGAQPR